MWVKHLIQLILLHLPNNSKVQVLLLWASPDSSAGKKKICLQCRRPRFDSWVGKFPWRRDRLPTSVFLGFPGGSAGKESACNAGDLASISGLGRSSGEGKGYPLQCSCLETPHGQRAWRATVHGVTKLDITERLSTTQHYYYAHCFPVGWNWSLERLSNLPRVTQLISGKMGLPWTQAVQLRRLNLLLEQLQHLQERRQEAKYSKCWDEEEEDCRTHRKGSRQWGRPGLVRPPGDIREVAGSHEYLDSPALSLAQRVQVHFTVWRDGRLSPSCPVARHPQAPADFWCPWGKMLQSLAKMNLVVLGQASQHPQLLGAC